MNNRNWPFGLLRKGAYGVIAADCPWGYVTWGQGSIVPQRAEDQHYKTMTIEELAALPVAQLAAPNCALFLWTISSHTPQAFWLADQWGFTFSSKAFCWPKTTPLESEKARKLHDLGIFWPVEDDGHWHMGMGHGSRRNSEDCWLFFRGNPTRIDKGVRELMISPRREHSRKPDDFLPRCERLFAGPYCELFSRTDRPGWASWGDEVGKFNE